MSLRYNSKTNEFVLVSNDEESARRTGLTLSTKVRGPGGEKVWFTNTAYAALPFYREADDAARAMLDPMWHDYMDSWARDSEYEPPAPSGINPKTGEPYAYMPFQKAGIAYALKHGNCLVGDEPGLGKTIQAVGLANAIEAQRVLVICPASIRLSWAREVADWSTLRRPTTYPILKSGDGVNPYANYTIISYDLIRNPHIHEALCEVNWDLMVLDEAHYLKTIDAKRTRATFGGGRAKPFRDKWLSQKAGRIMALTGTPLPNRPRECYTLARSLHPESIDWMGYDAFCHRFNPSGRLDNGHALEMKGRLPELQARLRCNFMVRRRKDEVLTDLPDKRYEFTYVEPNGGIREVLAKERLIDFDPKSLLNPDFRIEGSVATVRREMGEAMAPRVIEHIRYLLDVVEIPKIVMFYHHTSVMEMLAEKLHTYGMAIRKGGTGTAAQQAAVDTFVDDADVRIFLGQLDTMEGADRLQHVTDHAVFAEPAWTPGRNEQCVDRLHRYGQHGNVIAQFLLAEGSFNERVLGAVLDKAHDIHDTLDRRSEA